MRDNTIARAFGDIEAKIDRMKRQSGASDKELVTLRLQMNAIVRIIKWTPLRWMFQHFVKKEYNAYIEQLEKRKAEVAKMKEDMEKQKQQQKVNTQNQKTGRNAPCHCGSGKKFKKCCIDKKDDIKVPTTPKEIEKAINKKKIK